LTCLWGNRPQVKPPGDFETDRGDFSPAKAAEVMKYGIGQIARQREQKDPRQGAMFANAVQKWLVELRDSVSRQFFLTKYFMATWRRAVRVFLNQLRWLPHGIPSSSRRFLLRERWKHARVEVIIMVGTSSVKYETVKLEVVAK
jgi:hypothetical protein